MSQIQLPSLGSRRTLFDSLIHQLAQGLQAETDADLTFEQFYRRTIPETWGVPRHIAYLIDLGQRAVDGELPRIAISMPPGHAKSDTITRRLPLYWSIGRNRPDACVLTGYSARFAEKNLSYPCREMARELEMLSPQATALDEWEFASGVRLIARGRGAAPTGINPIKLLICDDPIKDRAEAQSEVIRQGLWDWWQGSIVQRFREGTSAFVIATRWHEDDLIGRLKATQPKGWLFINLPAIALEGDPLGRKPGEALWPEVHPIAHLEKIRAEMGEREFEALYQGNPTPREGSLFQVSKIRVMPLGAIPAAARTVDAWDLAASEDQGDYTARARIFEHDGTYYVRFRRFRHEPAERNRLIRQDAEIGRPGTIRIPQDPGAGGKESAQAMVRLLAGFNVKAAPEGANSKEVRAEPLAAQVNAGNVVFVDDEAQGGAPIRDSIEEFRQFPGGKHDDMVDAAANAFNEISAPTASWAAFNP